MAHFTFKITRWCVHMTHSLFANESTQLLVTTHKVQQLCVRSPILDWTTVWHNWSQQVKTGQRLRKFAEYAT